MTSGPRTCLRCATVFPPELVAFAFKTRVQSVCVVCLQEADADRAVKRADYNKAISCQKNHALTMMRTGVLVAADVADAREQLATRFGWSIERMQKDIADAFMSSCPYCTRSFASMPNGLGEVTLDIFDAAQPPYYGINTRWVCQSCNRSKSRSTPGEWAAKVAVLRHRSEWVAVHDRPGPPPQLFAVEDAS